MAVPRQRVFVPPRAFRGAALGLARGDLWEGEDVARFERDFASFMGVPDAIAVGSGRSGLRILLESLDLPPKSEIICSGFGYPVVPFLVKRMGFELRFVDCELETLGMDPEALRAAITDKTAAVITTHLYGVPCRIGEIASICESAGAALIEDCAHCYGAAEGGQKVGSFGRGAYFSFETSKPINTMGGGMITTTDAALGARIREAASSEPRRTPKWLLKRLFRTSFEHAVTSPVPFQLGVYPALRMAARKPESEDRYASGYHGDEVTLKGRTGRYTNYQARLGLSQMERMGPAMQRRRANAERLLEALKGIVHLQLPAGPQVEPNYMLVTALFPDMSRVARELLARGVDTKHHYMRDCSGLYESDESFPNSARAEREVLHLPAYPELSTRQIDEIAASVRAVAASSPAAAEATVGASR